jgi:hypothetical protein
MSSNSGAYREAHAIRARDPTPSVLRLLDWLGEVPARLVEDTHLPVGQLPPGRECLRLFTLEVSVAIQWHCPGLTLIGPLARVPDYVFSTSGFDLNNRLRACSSSAHGECSRDRVAHSRAWGLND